MFFDCSLFVPDRILKNKLLFFCSMNSESQLEHRNLYGNAFITFEYYGDCSIIAIIAISFVLKHKAKKIGKQ